MSAIVLLNGLIGIFSASFQGATDTDTDSDADGNSVKSHQDVPPSTAVVQNPLYFKAAPMSPTLVQCADQSVLDAIHSKISVLENTLTALKLDLASLQPISNEHV